MKTLNKLRFFWLMFISVGLALSVSLYAPQAWAQTAGNEVKSVIDEVMVILHNSSLSGATQQNQRTALVEKATSRLFDYREMAKRCLGETWDTLKKNQQEEFVGLFSRLLRTSYARRLNEIRNAKVVYQPEIVKPEYTEVSIVILRPNDRIPVSFRLLKEAVGWRVYDVIIEGVSIVSNLQSQFARVIQGSSYQGLRQSLQARVQADY
jgi:phospholipid transport system substrate-binding protein